MRSAPLVWEMDGREILIYRALLDKSEFVIPSAFMLSQNIK